MPMLLTSSNMSRDTVPVQSYPATGSLTQRRARLAVPVRT